MPPMHTGVGNHLRAMLWYIKKSSFNWLQSKPNFSVALIKGDLFLDIKQEARFTNPLK